MTTTRLLVSMEMPTNSLYFTTPYEKEAMELRNAAVKSMANHDIAMLAWIYLQNNKQKNERVFEATMLGLLGAMFLVDSIITLNPWLLLQPALISPIIAPLVSSGTTLNETKNACQEWLEQKIGHDAVEQINKLSLNSDGIFALRNVLLAKGIETDSSLYIRESQLRI